MKNDEKRAIWFKKVLWSYVPIHPMGCIVPLGFIIFIPASFALLNVIMSSLGRANQVPDIGYIMIPTIIIFLIVCERHSE